MHGQRRSEGAKVMFVPTPQQLGLPATVVAGEAERLLAEELAVQAELDAEDAAAA